MKKLMTLEDAIANAKNWPYATDIMLDQESGEYHVTDGSSYDHYSKIWKRVASVRLAHEVTMIEPEPTGADVPKQLNGDNILWG